MPRVPIYSGPQVTDQPARGGQIDIGAATAGTRAQQRGAQDLLQAGNVLDNIATREATRQAYEAETSVRAQFLEFSANMQTQRQGDKAVGVVDDTDKWLSETAAKVGQGLDPYAKSIASKSLNALALQARQGAMTFERTQLERAFDASVVAAKSSTISLAAANPTPENVELGVRDIEAKNADWGARKGWSPEQLKVENLKDTTVLHGNVIRSMMQKDPMAAENYFERFKGQIDGARHDEIMGGLRTLTAEAAGSKAADTIWEKLGPRADGQPVELDKMQAAAREEFPNDPTRQKAAVMQLKERASAFNSAERERAANNTNTVMDQLAQGASFAQVSRTPAFLALRGEEKLKIREHQEQQLDRAMSRAASASTIAFNNEQRQERVKTLRGAGEYLDLSNPDVLARMSEAEVRAKMPALGAELTGKLLEKKRSLSNDVAKNEAKIDTDDFNNFATRLGLNPDAKAGSAEKARLGEVRYRTEQLIDAAQREKGKLLTRSEKSAIMQREVATTVQQETLGGFGPSREKPAILLDAKDAARVVVPREAKADVSRALADLYKRNPDNPDYAPTDANMRRVYLNSLSRATRLIQPEKK